MKKVVLLRHGESVWNKENRFTGWTDVDLSEKGVEEARKAGRLLKEQGFKFDIAYTSYLKRAIKTMNNVLEEMEQMWIPVEKSWRLNEKHYGMLQGLNKAETALKYGDEQVKIWRRSYDIAPNPQEATDPAATWNDSRYAGVPKEELPLTESLKDTVARAIPYWQNFIVPALLGENGCCSAPKAHNEILITAHGNSLRAIIKYLKNISDSDIIALNLPTAVPYLFVFDDNMNLVKDEFLGDPEEIKALIEAVANQGKSK